MQQVYLRNGGCDYRRQNDLSSHAQRACAAEFSLGPVSPLLQYHIGLYQLNTITTSELFCFEADTYCVSKTSPSFYILNNSAKT